MCCAELWWQLHMFQPYVRSIILPVCEGSRNRSSWLWSCCCSISIGTPILSMSLVRSQSGSSGCNRLCGAMQHRDNCVTLLLMCRAAQPALLSKHRCARLPHSPGTDETVHVRPEVLGQPLAMVVRGEVEIATRLEGAIGHFAEF